MKLLALFAVMFHCIQGTSFSSGAYVITNTYISQITAIPAGDYRVYAVYATGYSSDLPSNIIIQGQGSSKSVLELSGSNDQNILSNSNILTAPFTSKNNNPKSSTGIPPFVPFTLYFVPTRIAVFPVVSGQYASTVDTALAGLSPQAMTILSAEPNFQIWGVTVTWGTVSVTNVGYDSPQQANIVLTLTSDNIGSTVLITGPIATVWNPASTNTAFHFSISRTSIYSGSQQPHDSISFLSSGWLNAGESYQMDYANNDLVRYRAYDYSRDTQITFVATVGTNFNSNAGDTMTLLCSRSNGQSSQYLLGTMSGQTKVDYCKTVSFTANTNTYSVDPIRFRVIIDSGAFSTSITTLLLSSLFALLLR